MTENTEHKSETHSHQKTEHSEHKTHQHKIHEHNAKQPSSAILPLAIVFLIVLAAGTWMIYGIQPGKQPAAAELNLLIIGADCAECYDIGPAIQILQADYTIKEIENITMENADEYITKYGLTRLPAIIFTGDIGALDLPELEEKDGAKIFTKIPAPYYDVNKKGIVGYVTITRLVDTTCADCFNISLIEGQMTAAGIIVKSAETLDANSEKGKQLIEKYNIENVPTLLFNDELLAYEQIKQIWKDFGSEEEDGTLVLRTLNPPYKNIKTGKIEGAVTMTYLVDKTCADCFETSTYNTLLKDSFSLYVKEEKTIDASTTEGKNLIKKYNITMVPTVILSSDAAAYPTLPAAWKQVGTTESDGTYVFRELTQLESYLSSLGKQLVYKNVTTNS
jgi:hypothetical protein